MKLLLPLLLTLCLLPATGHAGEFDCQNPPFGEAIAQFDGFHKYKEAGPVSYYTHDDPDCGIAANKYGKPEIAYAVVDGKLYAQIVTVVSEELTRGIKERAALYKAGKIKAADLSPGFRDQVNADVQPKMKEGENSSELIWNFPDRKLRAKFKVDYATNTVKLNYYYLPLWETLQDK
ncbi:hypothetical protein DND132_0479 [Pseudodesulfovibrio mercurii]|uniref:Uncharacterized protein n=1 Tax=Pseudodesulfovibrio mercurii TaxID=641491 RepID=F0JFE0_9BACT|nr:hypothetical protein [Pseudodesulfovibrio mercurii]EGB13696.1 hypothetical protein DND132_0479 [Pseudodesulfovibrio mercurii]